MCIRDRVDLSSLLAVDGLDEVAPVETLEGRIERAERNRSDPDVGEAALQVVPMKRLFFEEAEDCEVKQGGVSL